MATNDHTVRRLAVAASAASVILTAAAFWLSYQHLHDVSAAHGLNDSGARAWAWPATVDLFIVIGELLILRGSIAGRVDRWAITLTIVGSVGSIALNVAGVGRHAPILDHVVAAVPPVAALLAFGALMRQIHDHITKQPQPAEQPEHSVYLPPSTPAPLAAVTEPIEPSRLLTKRDVMAALGCSPSTVGTWVSRGKLTPVGKDARGGNLFDPAQLDQLTP